MGDEGKTVRSRLVIASDPALPGERSNLIVPEITSSSRICGTPRNDILNRLYQSEISLKPGGAEFHGAATVGRICQAVVSALDDMNLFRCT